MRTRRLVLLAAALGLIAACGADTGGTAPDPADATTCAHLADAYVEATTDLVALLGDRTDADMESPPADLQAAGDDWFATASAVWERSLELCAEGELDALLCEARDGIAPAGEAAERLLRDNFPTCSD